MRSETIRPAPGARRLGPIVGRAAALLLLCVSALAALVLIVVPGVTGSQTYTVLTSSMAPQYGPGTFLIVKPHDFAGLQAGDVVTYQLESGRPDVVTHRIVGFSADQAGNRLLITQGDNNDLPDAEPVSEIQVRGKLLYAVPYVGFLADALGSSERAVVVDLLGAGLVIYGIVLATRALTSRRHAQHQPATDTPDTDQDVEDRDESSSQTTQQLEQEVSA